MTDAAAKAASLAEEKLVALADARPPKYSDEGLAQQFAHQHGDAMRYVAAWARWHIWAGARWTPDSTLAAFDRARAICRAASAETDKSNKNAIASAKTVAAVERLARADRRIAATVDQWDADPDALNIESEELADDS